ncbi:gastric triacylglycerol lipase-like isoform X2 [Tigriopus californicus]|uniref:gastric triacylglycerol lipase-like isoform X2 n=1 Tax=Tigriopus californicus TaxID=6832 RepID=UPI0027DA4D0C|nr:gastric triacylglycerol lipase-like isoform X2 [Tigriopus californicus]
MALTNKFLIFLLLHYCGALNTHGASEERISSSTYLVQANSDSLPVPEMVKKYGYKCEEHEYQTSDGYVNVLHRLLPQQPESLARKAVFLQHGLLGTSADFVMGSPEKSLGYILVDNGFDVWLGNARGNIYSRKHINLSINSDAYWDFSFDEMGMFDLPAAIHYILDRNTNSTQLDYIGHSMGTTMFWVAMDQNESWMKARIRMMFALAPVAQVQHIRSPIRLLAPFSNQVEFLFRILGIRQFEPTTTAMQLFEKYVCDETMFQLKLCEDALFLLCGFDQKQMNLTLLPIILGHEPGGTSTKTIIHFAQMVSSKAFRKFDLGYFGNLKHYGQSSPPKYQLRSVALPVTLLWSDNDWLADPQDVDQLVKTLPNIQESYHVPMPEFNHIDFLWGLNATEYVYKKILLTLDKRT